MYIKRIINPFAKEPMDLFDWCSLDAPVPREAGVSLVSTSKSRVSRFGGAPEFVDEWPKGKGGPIPFLCQLDLRELSADVGKNWPGGFPKEGVLSIFFDEDRLEGNSPASERESWAILFDDGRARRVADHGPKKDRYPSLWVKATTKPPGKAPLHQVGGAPKRIQYFDSVSCGHFRSGDYLRYPETVRALKDAGVREDAFVKEPSDIIKAGRQLDIAKTEPSRLGAGLRNWSLLLQIDWEPRIDLSIADAGRIYIFGDRHTLRTDSQASAWLELEFH